MGDVSVMFDVVYVAHNSERWIDRCFNSWLHLDYDLNLINIYVVDNASCDETVTLLRKFKEQEANRFASFQIIEETTNWGFGKANNLGFLQGKSDFVCFFNIDTELFSDTFSKLEEEVLNSDENVALLELRQFPYEHPKIYNVVSGETSWSSGAAFAVRRNIYNKIGGFDEKIFMYAEDVDLSWRIRSQGYLLKYVPRVRIYHYSYEKANEIKPNQYIYGVINNLLLRLRFGTLKDVIIWYVLFLNIFRKRARFKGAKIGLLKAYFRHFILVKHFRSGGRYRGAEVANFLRWEYDLNRDGSYYKQAVTDKKPLVSVIVRTCGRPCVLKECLISLKRQTYNNLEIVVVEDGINKSEELIRDQFADMNILYKATYEKVGRSKIGNIAMQMANGEYLNFLDDDDLFFADHIEVLVTSILLNNTLAAYATAFETEISIKSKEPYLYETRKYIKRHTQAFDRIMLCHHNYIPIQCIMFHKELFVKYGGLDETVDALEDWDMWLRYAMYTDFIFILKTTSIYRVPADQETKQNRQKDLDNALLVMRKKHEEYKQPISARDIAMLYQKAEYRN